MVFGKLFFVLLFNVIYSHLSEEDVINFEKSTDMKCACTFPNGSILNSNGIHKSVGRLEKTFFSDIEECPKMLQTQFTRGVMNTQIIQEVLETIKNKTVELYNVIVKALIDLKDSAIATIKRYKDEFLNNMKNSKSQTAGAVETVRDLVVTQLKQVVNILLDRIQAVVVSAANAVGNVIKRIEKKIEDFLNRYRYNTTIAGGTEIVLENGGNPLAREEFNFDSKSFKMTFNGRHQLDFDMFSIKCTCEEET